MDKMGLWLLFLYVNFLAFTGANRPGLKIQMTIMVALYRVQTPGVEWNIAELEYGHDILNNIFSPRKRRSDFPTGIRTISNKEEKIEFDAEFYKFYKALAEVLKTLEGRLESVLRDNGITGVVTGRIKSLSSQSKKMENRRNKGLSQNNGHCRRPSYFSNHR